jgi:hypothetical protein
MLAFSRAQVGTGIAVALVCLVVVYAADYALTQGDALDVRVSYPQHEPRLLTLEREAVEAAFRQQITTLYLSWMKDETGQPARALRGARQARRAYAAIMDAIDRREREGK